MERTMIAVFVVLLLIHLYLEYRMGNKLDAITAAIADVKATVSAEFDNLVTAVTGEAERIAQKLADAIAAGGDPAALQAEVQGAVDSLTDLKTTIADKVGSLKTSMDAIDGVVGNIDGTTSTPAITLTADVTAGASPQTVSVSDSTGLTVGQSVTVDSGASVETVVLTDVPSSGLIAGVFTLDHAAGVAVVPVPVA